MKKKIQQLVDNIDHTTEKRAELPTEFEKGTES